MFARVSWMKLAVGALVAAWGQAGLAQVEPIKVVPVNCAQGGSIAHAMTLGDERRPMVLVVSGTCTESVSITRDDVTLRAGADGGAIVGMDPAVDVVNVIGSRATLDGLAISGGRNGIRATAAAGLVVRNAVVSDTGRSGVTLGEGTSARIEGCTIQRNPRDGVALDSAHAVILGSLVSQNGRIGIAVVNGASARIGVDGQNVPSGTTITQNGGSGVVASLGAAVYVAVSEITGNGTDAASLVGRAGVAVAGASATLVGGNTIANNLGQGVSASRGANVTVGDPTLGLGTMNTISGNLGPGLFGFMGSALQIRDATITGNAAFGVGLSLKSHGQISASTVSNNGQDGIRLIMGSGLFPQAPGTPSVVSGNGGWGLNCTDGESSYINSSLLTISGNVSGAVAPSCTGF